MMKKFSIRLFLFLFLFSVKMIYPQEFTCSISGIVVDGKTHEKITGANVFVSETTWGASTDNNGVFKINNLPPGSHEIVVSIIGFEITVKNISLKKNEHKKLDFILVEKTYELETIEVVSERPENWDNNLAEFKKYFLGQGRFTKECKIINEEVLFFNNGAYGELYAKSDRPLKAVNNALGYNIEIVLVNFKWDSRQGRVEYSIKTKFEEILSNDVEQKNKWMENRKKVYNGSISHFLKCLKDNNFSENGYTICTVPRFNRNPQFVAHISDAIESSSQLLKRGVFPGEAILNFGDRLEIQYSPNASELNISWLDLNYAEITLDQFAYPEEYMPFQTIGYWAKLGIADLLPKYYNASADFK